MAKATATATAVKPGLKIVGSGVIDPRELVVDQQFNGRRYGGKVDNMTKSLLENGQESPITIRDKDGRKHVVFGVRRSMAGLEITTKGLLGEGVVFPLRYEEVECTDAEAFLANLIENMDREDLSVIDHANNYLRLTMEPHNMSQRDISKRLGVSDALVSRALTLVRGVKEHPPLSAKIQRMVHLGKIPSETAYEMVVMAEEDREELVAQILAGKTVTMQDAKAKNAKRKPGTSGEQVQGGKALTAKAIRLPFESVVTKWPEEEEMTPYVQVCDLFTKLCTGALTAKTVLKKIKDLMA